MGSWGKPARTTARLVLAAFFAVAGVGHFVATDAFRAQVPPWLPAPEWVIWVSGVVELAIALALAFAPRAWRPLVGWLVAGFLVVVFPGNISQFVTGADAFGLNSDLARGIRLVMQPALIVVVLWSTGAVAAWRRDRTVRPDARR